jgi:fatty acid desaturase
VDVSAEKLKNLAERKAIIAQVRKRTFAGMLFSIVGLIVLITVVYAFLNAATKGYYAWALRIAGVIFALVVIILLFVK